MACFNDAAYGDWANSTTTTTQLNLFLCPSDSPPRWNHQGSGAMFNKARAPGNNYFASLGSTLEFDGTKKNGPPNGVFEFTNSSGGSCFGVRDIIDGTSSTIAFGEWRMGSGNRSMLTIPTDIIFIGMYPPGVSRNTAQMSMPMLNVGFRQWISLCEAAARSGTGVFGKSATLGQNWSLGLIGYSMGNVLTGSEPEVPELQHPRLREHPEPRHVRAEQPAPRRCSRAPERRLGAVHEGIDPVGRRLEAGFTRPE